MNHKYEDLLPLHLAKVRCTAIIRNQLSIIDDGMIYVYCNNINLLQNINGLELREDIAKETGYKYGFRLFDSNRNGEQLPRGIDNFEILCK